MPVNNPQIEVTAHAVERFTERLNPGVYREQSSTSYGATVRAIKKCFAEAYYISDNDKGILFRNFEMKLDLVVKGRKILTLFAAKKKEKDAGHR